MLMIDNIKNFLYDKKYFINLYDNYIHVFNYIKINDFKNNQVILIMPDFKIIIVGKDFLITKMLKNEILIKGNVTSLEKIYDHS